MNDRARRRGWYHGWNIVAVCVAAQMAGIALTMNCFSLFLADWTAEFGVPVSTIALSITLFSFAVIASSYLIGVCVDRYPIRYLFGGALALLAVAHGLVAMTGEAWQLIALYVVVFPFAIGFCAAIPSQSLVSRWFVKRVGLAMGLTAAGLALSGVIFPPIIVALLPIIGWRGVWVAFAGLILFVVLPVAMLVLRDRPDLDDPFGYVTAPDRDAPQEPASSVRDILTRRNFWVIIVAFVSVQFVAMTISVNITPIATSYGAATSLAGLFISIFSAAALVAKLGTGWLVDRIGNRLPLAGTALATALGTLLLSFPHSGAGYLLGTAMIVGLSGGVWTLLASSILAEFGPASFGRAFGLACALSPLGTFAPPVVARVQEVTGSYAAPLATLAGLCLVAAGAVLLLYRVRGSDVEVPAT